MSEIIMPITTDHNQEAVIGYVYAEGGKIVAKMNPHCFLTATTIKNIFGNVAFRVIECVEDFAQEDGIQIRKAEILWFSLNSRELL